MKFFLGALIVFFSFAKTQIDESNHQLSQQYDTALRWDNIENEMDTIYTQRASFCKNCQINYINFLPHGEIRILLDKWSALRIISPEEMPRNALEVSYSSGLGIYQQIEGKATNNKNEYVYAPQLPQPCIVKIYRPGYYQKSLLAGVFVARYQPLEKIAPNRNLHCFSNNHLDIRKSWELHSKSFWEIKPSEPITFRIKGSRRLEIQNYFVYSHFTSQSIQHYQIRISLDNKLLRVIDFDTTRERFRIMRVGEKARSLSFMEKGYVNIPPGKYTVKIDSTAHLYMRLVDHKQGDYLFPRWNEPQLNAKQLREKSTQYNSLWAKKFLFYYPNAIGLTNKYSDDILWQEKKMRLLAYNNSYKYGGLFGARFAQGIAIRHFDNLQFRAIWQDFLGFYTFYQNLLPDCKCSSTSKTTRYFYKPQLLGKTRKIQQRIFNEQFIGSQRKASSAIFFEVPNKNNLHTYSVLPSQVDRRLRLVFHSDQKLKYVQRVWIQQDNSVPEFVDIHGFSKELHNDYYMPSQWQSYNNIDHQLSEKKIHLDLPHSIIQGKVAEIDIHHSTKKIRIWRENSDISLEVGVHILKAKPYELTESEYWESVRRIEQSQLLSAIFRHYMAKEKSNVVVDRESLKFIYNHWKPLSTLCDNTSSTYKQSYERNIDEYPNTPQISLSIVLKLYQKAKFLKKQKKWLESLALWRKILNSGHYNYQNIAKIERTKALLNLGENYLARRYLHGLVVHEKNKIVRRKAMEILIKLYKIQKNSIAIRQLLVMEFTQDFALDMQNRLAKFLLREGDYQLALMLFLSLPKKQSTVENILHCCVKLNWWQTFHKFNSTLPKIKSNYWLGVFYSYKKQLRLARDSFENSTTQGKKLAGMITQSFYISDKLRSKNIETRLHGIELWEKWLKNDVRNYVWEEDISSVTSFSGSDQLYTINRNLYSQGFVSSPKKPVIIEVLGPKKIRLEMRSMIKNYEGEEWIIIRQHGQLSTIPNFINQTTNQNLRFVTKSDHSAYRLVVKELEIPRGRHKIEIYGEFLPLWVRVYSSQPFFEIGDLPQLTPFTLQKICQNDQCNVPLYETDIPEYLITSQKEIICVDDGSKNENLNSRRPFTYMLNPTVEIQPQKQHAFWWQLSDEKRLWLALRMGWKKPILKYFDQHKHTLSSEEKLLSFSYISHRFPEKLLDKFPLKVKEASYLNQNLWLKLMNLPMEENREGAVRKMRLLYRRLCLYPQLKIRVQLQAQKIYSKYFYVTELQSIYAKIMETSTWKKVENVEYSDGLLQKEVIGFKPESPKLRLRQNLFPVQSKKDIVIFGKEKANMVLKNITNVKVIVRCKAFYLGNLRPKTVLLNYQLNQQAIQSIKLHKQNYFYQFSIDIPQGKHHLQIWINNPILNQYVILNFLEKQGMKVENIQKQVKRSYYVASRKNPIVFYIEGPTILRMDELRGEKTISRYHSVEFGLRKIRIFPSKNMEQAFFRFFYQANTTEKKRSQEHLLTLYHKPFSPIIEQQISSEQQFRGKVQLRDEYSLGGQEDGTWTVKGAVARRRVFDDDDGDIDARQYSELSFSHRYYNPWYDTYFKTQLLNRFHQDGGPTLGVSETLYHRLYDIPLSISLYSSFFMQWPDGDVLTPKKGAEWSINFRGTLRYLATINPKTDHLMKLDIFAYYLSLKNDDDFDIEDIDQDIFTAFKADHLWGLSVADTLIHRPWLDTEWRFGGAITFNENVVTPDRFIITAEWRQLIGTFEVDLSYRYAIFFPDDDRDQFVLRDSVRINVLWNYWCRNQNRLEMGANANYDFDSGEVSSTVFLSFHWGYGRAYRDFSPSEVRFRSIRHRRIYQNDYSDNNHFANF
ncbi:hypothetical protein [Candidatus Uabimicrobium sp. HlEnr_7]|uniref:hypothetical protein n=1 Tax=Candidatus Uabimicrobium helgolandensis TaxID=3095367 RepID=UPI0035582584